MSESIKDVCICIPARYNSSRLPGKLLYNIGNKTCIQHTIGGCLLTGLVIYILTDHELIYDHVIKLFDYQIANKQLYIFIADQKCSNGTERISKNLDKIPEHYNIIVNVQADEPFIDYRNIMYAIEKHSDTTSDTTSDDMHFYTTLHQPLTITTDSDIDYLNSTSCITVCTTLKNKVLMYSRNIIPWNKKAAIDKSISYNIFTGIYVFNRHLLKIFHTLPDTPLQQHEDIEQLKILEHDYTVYSFETQHFNEISLNDLNDYEYLYSRYLT